MIPLNASVTFGGVRSFLSHCRDIVMQTNTTIKGVSRLEANNGQTLTDAVMISLFCADCYF